MCNNSQQPIQLVTCASEAAELKRCDQRTIERQCANVWSKETPPRARKCGTVWLIDKEAVAEFTPRPKKTFDFVGVATLKPLNTVNAVNSFQVLLPRLSGRSNI